MRLEVVVLLCCVALCVTALRHEEQRDQLKTRRRRGVMRDVQSVGQLRKEQRRRVNAVEDDLRHNMLHRSTAGATISEMFSLCDPVTLHRFEKKHHAMMRTWTRTPHIEDVHRVKCDVYSRLHQCVEGATLPANTWSCMRTHCGDQQLTQFIERASRDHRKNTCRNVTTDDGKIRCVFERLHAARSCDDLRHVCEAHPYDDGAAAEVCGRHRGSAARGGEGDRTGEQEYASAGWPHGRRMKRSWPPGDREGNKGLDLNEGRHRMKRQGGQGGGQGGFGGLHLNEGRLLHRKVDRIPWP